MRFEMRPTFRRFSVVNCKYFVKSEISFITTAKLSEYFIAKGEPHHKMVFSRRRRWEVEEL